MYRSIVNFVRAIKNRSFAIANHVAEFLSAIVERKLIRGCLYEARLTGLSRFFRVLWWLKNSGELQLKGIAILSNVKVCQQAE